MIFLVEDGGVSLDLILKSYGVAAPAILALCAALRILWTRLQASQDEMSRVRDVQLEKVVPALIQNTDQLERSAQVLERTATVMSTVHPDPELWRRVLRVLEDAEDERRRTPP